MINRKFTFQTYLPSQQKYLRFTQFSGNTHLTIGKYIQNNDIENTIKEFENIIQECCTEQVNLKHMTNVDIFCILLNLRIMCISQTFDFEGVVETKEERMKKTQKLDLYDILDKVSNHKAQTITSINIDDQYKINLGLPKGFRVEEIETLIVDVIDSIEVLGIQYDMSDMTPQEKTRVLDELPGNVLVNITKHIKKLDEQYRIKVFENISHGDLSDIHLKLFDNSLFEFIKAMYNCNLQEQYYIRYIMVKRLGFLLEDVETISPIDTQNYINLYREELEEERKAQETQSGQSKPSMSLPNPGYSEQLK